MAGKTLGLAIEQDKPLELDLAQPQVVKLLPVGIVDGGRIQAGRFRLFQILLYPRIKSQYWIASLSRFTFHFS